MRLAGHLAAALDALATGGWPGQEPAGRLVLSGHAAGLVLAARRELRAGCAHRPADQAVPGGQCARHAAHCATAGKYRRLAGHLAAGCPGPGDGR